MVLLRQQKSPHRGLECETTQYRSQVAVRIVPGNDPNDPSDLPAEGEAGRGAPEVEAAGVNRLFEVLEGAVVSDVAAEADVIGGKAHRASTQIEAPVIAAHIEQLVVAVDLALEHADPAG